MCDAGNNPTDNSFATDASGPHIYVTNYTQATIYAPDGTQVYPSVKDTNGNFFSVDGNGNVIDPVGRTPVTVTSNCNGQSNQTCYNVLNSQGFRSTFTVTTESISVSTAFGQSGITEDSGSIIVIQSIQLPDLTTYQFNYDSGTTPGHYGLLTSVTLPTGGQVTYGYTTFQDAYGNMNRWINSRVSGGGTWSYTPAVITTCGTTCTQKVTVTKPSADTAVYAFTLYNGAWRTTVQSYTGGRTLLSTVSNSWDLNHLYDGNGLRVAKKSSATTCASGTVMELYWRTVAGTTVAETDGSGSTTNSAYNEYVFFAGRRIAQRTGTGAIFYYFADQVGSTRTITTGSGPGQTPGQLCYDADFTPYGQEISHTERLQTSVCPPNYKFTGYERDSETGLDYAFARYYSSRLGRFLSTDPLGGSIGNLQSHNAYAYVVNNPMNFTDPSGLVCSANYGLGDTPCNPGNSGGGGGSGGFGGYDPFFLLDLAFQATGIERNPAYWDNFDACWLGDCPGVDAFLPVYGNWGVLSLLGLSTAGNPTAAKMSFYVQHGTLLNQCIHTVFGADASQIPTQTMNNAPILNTTKNQDQLTAMAGTPAVAWNQPYAGPHGTVFISKELYNSTGSNTLNAIYGTYAHELANILDERLNPPGTTGGQPYGRTYGNPFEPEGDSDTGAQVEICMFGSMQYPNQH